MRPLVDVYKRQVYGFDIPVPALDEEFDVALIGTKGTWYDHKVSVSNPVSYTHLDVYKRQGFFFGAGMSEAMGGAILLSMLTGFACTISAIEKNKKE